jgi:hypothetical protein
VAPLVNYAKIAVSLGVLPGGTAAESGSTRFVFFERPLPSECRNRRRSRASGYNLRHIVSIALSGVFFSLAGIARTLTSGSDQAGMFGAMLGVGAIVVFPILYGCMGFLGSLIVAWLYNLLAGMVGGIELDIK